MKPPRLVLAAALGLSLLGGACIFVIDETGMSTRAAWSSWDGGGPTLRGSGVAASEARGVADFRGVALRGAIDARVRVGEARSVVVRADDNLLEHVVTRVEDGMLIVEMERGSYRFETDLLVEVAVPELEALEISGSGEAAITGLSGPKLRISIAGSGDVTAAGSADELSVSISGSGDVALFDLKVRKATVSIAGSGDVELDVAESLSADISGSGDVRFRGSPEVRRSIAGSGSVERE
jgi:hypothetical protein